MDAPPVLRSELLSAPHGFSTRQGGVSDGPYSSLNLSISTGDEAARVQENRRRLALAAGVDPGRLYSVSQVHGDRVVWVPPANEATVGQGRHTGGGTAASIPEADAVGTCEPNTAVAIMTADCVPILLCDEKGTRVMAVHSGWRGTALRIAARAVEALTEAGTSPGALFAAIGPCIRACCYEVSEDVAERFRQGFGDAVVDKTDDGTSTRPHLDLAVAVRRTLLEAGVAAAHIDLVAPCTACDRARFYSHRRDAGRTGRHMSFITRM